MKHWIIASFLTIFALSACQQSLIKDKDDTGGGSGDAVWEKLSSPALNVIQNIYATPFELYVVDDLQFQRFDANNDLLEKRPLAPGRGVQGPAALSDNTMVRYTLDDNEKQQIEFHLTKNPASIYKIPVADMKDADDTFLELEFLGRQIGAFNRDGNLFIVPAKRHAENHYSFFLYEITQNSAHTEILSVTLNRRIEVPAMAATFANLTCIRPFNNFFFVGSKDGAFRINPNNGEVTKIFNQWMLDFIFYDTKLYAVGFNKFDLHSSDDDGITWERLNKNSELQFTESANGLIFTQNSPGSAFQLASDDLLKTSVIEYDPLMKASEPGKFFAIEFFQNKYYFGTGKDVYFTEKIVTK